MPIIFQPPSRTEAMIQGVIYLLLGAAGVWVLITPPVTIEGTIGQLAVYLWGGLCAVAVSTSVAAFARRFRWEYILLYPVITGVSIYVVTLWSLVPDTPTRGPQTLIVTTVTLGLLRRLVLLRKFIRYTTATSQEAA